MLFANLRSYFIPDKEKKVKNMLFNTFCNYIFCKIQDIHYTLANYYLICIVF